ncbi:MAG TPA: hypothetical protein VHL78_01750 [Actinomycetota bacterium]|nr:hypothetical protein [Actinomycetota bacterium]
MRTRIALTLLPLIAALAGSVLVLGPARSAEDCGDGTATSSFTSDDAGGDTAGASAASLGAGVAATSEDEVVIVDSTGERHATPHVGSPAGVLRHARASTGMGTVYVNDVEGQDIVTAVRTDGVVEHPIAGEAAHPTFAPSGEVIWARDFSSLTAWSPSTGAVRSIARPPEATAVFSPLVTPVGELLVVAQEPVPGQEPHGDGLDNVWRYDEARGAWTRLTSFTATADRWTALRTPVVDRDGGVLFVRVRGSASATRAPAFELWRLAGGAASKVRDLPGEMYLAGVTDGGILWNVEQDGQWRLLLDDGRSIRDVGCGGAQVDPRSESDPDIVDQDGTETSTTETDAALADPQLGLLVGDFASAVEAQAVAAAVGPAFRVVGRAEAPLAVAPGTYAVVRNFAPDEDMEAALAAFRSQFPKYAETSYVVPLIEGAAGEE